MDNKDIVLIAKIILVTVIVVGIVVGLVFVILGPDRMNPGLKGSYTAELIMPGNTVVEGTCDKVIRIGDNWSKYHINGKWYACADFRVVLKEGN